MASFWHTKQFCHLFTPLDLLFLQYPALKLTYYVQWALNCVQHYDICVSARLIARSAVSTLYSLLNHGHDWCVCLPVWGCVWRHNCPEPPLSEWVLWYRFTQLGFEIRGQKGHSIQAWLNISLKWLSTVSSTYARTHVPTACPIACYFSVFSTVWACKELLVTSCCQIFTK